MAPQGAGAEPKDTGGDHEEVSVFIPKAALMGKTCKAGDSIQMTVKDVDPETGDVEAVCQGGGYGEEQPSGTQAAVDNADLEGEKGGM